jgi:hypothetical protein
VHCSARGHAGRPSELMVIRHEAMNRHSAALLESCQRQVSKPVPLARTAEAVRLPFRHAGRVSLDAQARRSQVQAHQPGLVNAQLKVGMVIWTS